MRKELRKDVAMDNIQSYLKGIRKVDIELNIRISTLMLMSGDFNGRVLSILDSMHLRED